MQFDKECLLVKLYRYLNTITSYNIGEFPVSRLTSFHLNLHTIDVYGTR